MRVCIQEEVLVVLEAAESPEFPDSTYLEEGRFTKEDFSFWEKFYSI